MTSEKILHTDDDTGITLAIFDDQNYALYRKQKSGLKAFSFHNRIHSAIKELCRRKANQSCADLKSWLVEFETALDEFAGLLAHTDPRNDAVRPTRSGGKAIAPLDSSKTTSTALNARTGGIDND